MRCSGSGRGFGFATFVLQPTADIAFETGTTDNWRGDGFGAFGNVPEGSDVGFAGGVDGG